MVFFFCIFFLVFLFVGLILVFVFLSSVIKRMILSLVLNLGSMNEVPAAALAVIYNKKPAQ